MNCFTKADIDSLPGIRVMVNAAPPANDNVTNETYPYFPATEFSSALSTIGSSTYSKVGHQRGPFVFANRRNTGATTWNVKPNDTPGVKITHDGTPTGKECRSCFSTVGLANAATRIQVRHILGLSYQSILDANPGLIAVYDYADWNQSDLTRRAEIFTQDFAHTQYGVTTTYRVCWDKVLLHPHNPVNVNKYSFVEIDYEVQDDRSYAITASFLHLLQYDIHQAGKKAFLLTNTLNAPGAIHSGITTSNLATIFAEWDHVTIWLQADNPDGSIPASYAAQLAMLPALTTAADWKKISLRFELGQDPNGADPGSTLADAAWVHAKLTEPGDLHPTFLQFHRNGAPVGGSCSTYTNQKIRKACFGV